MVLFSIKSLDMLCFFFRFASFCTLSFNLGTAYLFVNDWFWSFRVPLSFNLGKESKNHWQQRMVTLTFILSHCLLALTEMNFWGLFCFAQPWWIWILLFPTFICLKARFFPSFSPSAFFLLSPETVFSWICSLLVYFKVFWIIRDTCG